jgi:hypothetical protein
MNIYLALFFFSIAIFALMFVLQTINKIPSDLITLREYYEERNMTEFYVHLAIMAGFWLVTGLLIYFLIYPAGKMALFGLGQLFKLVSPLF